MFDLLERWKKKAEERAERPLTFRYIYVMGLATGALFAAAVFLCIYLFSGSFLKEQDVKRLLLRNYLGDITEQQLDDGKYAGMVAALGDRYAVYYTAEEYAQQRRTGSGLYLGIGAVLSQDTVTKDIRVVEVYPGTPAEKAGLLAADRIVSANATDVREMDLAALTALIRAGDPVTFLIEREGEAEPFAVTVTPEEIVTHTVFYEMREDGIGYIRISSFRENTPDQFSAAMEDLTAQGMRALAIDLRNNGGGSLDAAVRIASAVMGERLVTYTEEKSGQRKEYWSEGKEDIGIPLAVLVNGETASASELFAGAIQDHGIGKIVGEKTFGKGIVQSVLQLRDGSGLRYTTAYYYTPNGRCIHGFGIAPDIEAALPPSADDPDAAETVTDAQYEAAREYLLGESGKAQEAA